MERRLDMKEALQHLIDATRAHFNSPTAPTFTVLAHNLLAEFPDGIDTENLIQYFDERPTFAPTYPNHPFSSRDYTLYSDQNFALDLYVWEKQDTAIHDHHFEGAFRVIEGENLELNFSFKSQNDHAGVLTFGELTLAGQCLLRRGGTRMIERAPAFVHQVFRLAPRVSTLCLRTQRFTDKDLSVYLFPAVRLRCPTPTANELRALQIFDLDHDSYVPPEICRPLVFNSWLLRRMINVHGCHLQQWPSWIQQRFCGDIDFAALERCLIQHASFLQSLSQLAP